MCRQTAISMMTGMMLLAASSVAADARIVVPQAMPTETLEVAASERVQSFEIRWQAFATLVPSVKVLAVLPLYLASAQG